MKRRNLGEEHCVDGKKIIYLDELTLKEFKQFIVKALSKPCTQRQCYLTTDPLTEKYLFWYHGQIRFISVTVVERMLKVKQLLYYSEHAFRIKNMIVGKDFKFKRDKAIRAIRSIFTKRENKSKKRKL